MGNVIYIAHSIEDNFLKLVSVFDKFERFASNTDDDEILSVFESNGLIMHSRNTSFVEESENL